MSRGLSIQYAEIDGIPVCIIGNGVWCERGMGHEGPHVIAPLIPVTKWDAAVKQGDETAITPVAVDKQDEARARFRERARRLREQGVEIHPDVPGDETDA